ncbi:autotransporter outer membrane beta-barrel domain-containing protein [Achromobacter deleyi]|uniref:autotransporter outer membrane beta-barrel domain-containing protein n=1 Tax=Achromobacter deleyi TaxID=1353891 RepID=UPI0014918545|nr:autotransporter outer membrane beta-barrel domain-containing protein [Achromobacter deleyi]QVQ26080.1 autotransporter outer membrane beta-barrel domain-containing protein [Achromobacter deleyi]UIP21639.1 autotransporter outer membrane beta-barrel domain-containing protein [Achromobacter deleyi]
MKKLTANLPACKGAATMLGLMLAQPALADISCPQPNPSTTTTCTVDATQSGNLTVDYTGGTGTGNGSGGYGGNYIVVNSGYLGPNPQQAALLVRLKGGTGSPDGKDSGTFGGWGGAITITNYGSVETDVFPTETPQGSAPGVWDDSSAQFGIYGASVGGTGGTPPDNFGGGSGGGGGNGSAVNISNIGQVQMQALPYGGVGIYGASIGGTGGNQMSAAGSDQVGGNGGNSDIVNITNTGSVSVSSGSAGRYAWGIGAESLGGAGGVYNGWGGTGGGGNPAAATIITNSGKVQVNVDVPGNATGNLLTNGVRGLYVTSQGNAGFTSSDGSDNGGQGGGFGTMAAVNNGQISVTTNSLQEPTTLASLSGGIVVVGLGGNGGGGPMTSTNTTGERGGNGGSALSSATVTLNNGSSITTSGSYLPGVSVISQGGDGGPGRQSSNGANGGNGGTVQVGMSGSAGISTYGTQSHGIVARSVGGGGGGVETSSGLVDFTPENAGVGGTGGTVNVTTGDASTGTAGGTIRTQGDYSIGILGQSMGGIGGTTTGNFEMFGNAGAEAGNGGASGAVNIDSRTAITTFGTSSHGIVAQAIGGGGGTAGASAGLVSVGGAGGSAVAGGTVYINQNGSLSINGSASIGMLAQSIGGGGGDGGSANGVAVIGGTAGGGGAGGQATANLSGGSVYTGGDHGYGIVSQSIGGGGGTGGAASAYDAGVGFSMAVAVGGTGGNGGAGGVATAAISNSSVNTGSSDSHGVIVQSVGGGGGAGGASVAQALTIAVPDEDASFGVAVSFAMGGSGSSGGAGSTATAMLTSAGITTQGANSQGVIVQSIGGGGGMGGSASATSTVIGTGDSVGGSLQSALGGSGGPGNTGGTASLVMQGSSIATSGDSANAILVQSVGGGGGAGGVGSATGRSINTDADVSITMALGGSGNSGGNGGTASLTIDPGSSVTTRGDGARAALLQSIGGGGGASQGGQVGLELSASEEDSTTDFRGSVSVGRGGGGGGNGGAINLNSDGNITTYGADADGLLAQSIGGSGGLGGAVGGNSGSTSPLPWVDDSGTTYQFNVAVGGTGGAGGNGGAIGSSSAPAILGASTQTYGDYADAAVVQSIGGGGGAGGASAVSSSVSISNVTLAVGGSGGNGGSGGEITAWLNGDGVNAFNTEGYGAAGVVLQSIGGGGGMAGSGSPQARGQMQLGGMQGNGGAATITGGSWATIQTKGDSAYGLVAQSIGGGGGIAMAGSASSAANPGSQQFSMIAGNASGGGYGGPVNVSTGLDLNTYGARAMGVVAQSIGAGGGIATTGTASGMGTIQLGSQRNSSYGANGGDVRLDLSGSITTRGAGAHGVVAQSIGGGGGILGDVSQAIQFNPQGFNRQSVSGSDGGAGGTVSVAFDGVLITSGANAHGIVAQSVGGGGGLAGGPQGGFAGATGQNGTGSPVAVQQSGTLQATGAGSAGIFAQSDGAAWVDPVGVVVNGNVQGGSGSGSGVWIAAGKENQLVVNAGASLGAMSDVAVRYDGYIASPKSTLTINNLGTLAGSTLCSNPYGNIACFLNNNASAVATDAVTYNANVRNDGLIVIGKPGQFQTLTVSGGLTQSNSGVLRADVDFDKLRSSRMVIEGDATLAGGMDVLPQALLPNRELPVVTVRGNSQGSLTAVDSPVFDYETRQIGPETRIRVESADFNASSMGLKENQSQVANHLQRTWDAGGNSALAPLYAQLDLASRQGAGAYRDSVANLSPGVTLAPAVQSAANMGQFTSSMMSCPTFTGADAMTGEQNCFWGQVSGRSTRQEGSRGTSGFDYDTVTYQFGGQREVSPGWFLGGSMAYENSRVRAGDGSVSGNGDSGYAGVVLKRQEGQWVFSAALGGGYGDYGMDRNIDIAGYQETVSSRPDVYGFNARLRAARTFAYGNMYVKPYMDLDVSYSRMPGYKESGSNPLALSVDGSDQFILGVSPMIEFGGRAELKNGAMLRPFLYAGASFLSQNEWTSSARLRGAPAGTGSFDTSLPIDDVIGNVGAGLAVMKAGGVDFRLQYEGQFSQHVRSNSASLKVMVPF